MNTMIATAIATVPRAGIEREIGVDEEGDWPREIWMAEREDHDQGVVTAVLSQLATVPRFAGDSERDRDFHKYVDVDIYESSERYYTELLTGLRAENEKLRGALEWYGDAVMAYSITQQNEPRSAVHADKGKRAREALKK